MFFYCCPGDEHKIDSLLLQYEKKMGGQTAQEVIHLGYCKFVPNKRKKKDIMCKIKSPLLNGYCIYHYPEKYTIYSNLFCKFTNRYNTLCRRIVKKGNFICNLHMNLITNVRLPIQDEKELLDLGVLYEDIYEINKIDTYIPI